MAGSHSLRYCEASVTRPRLGEPGFFSVGYVDDQQFVRYDSESNKMGPRATWIEGMWREDPEYWERNTQRARRNAQALQAGLENLRGYFNQSAGGVHTLQLMSSYQVTSELRFRRGFYQLAYDGLDYLALDMETYTWTAAVPQAENTKHKWEEDRSIEESAKAYLEETCVKWLKKYLDIGKETLQRADPPSARVTRHTAPHGEVTLRCRARDFNPSDTWLREGQEVLQDAEFIETRPSGDGTFQKWAAVGVTPGQEREYTCRVQHEGLPEPLTLQWESPSPPMGLIVGGIAAGLLLIAVIAVLWYWRKNSGEEGGDCVPAAGNDSAQRSDVSLTASNETLGTWNEREVELERIALSGPEEENQLTVPFPRPHIASSGPSPCQGQRALAMSPPSSLMLA